LNLECNASNVIASEAKQPGVAATMWPHVMISLERQENWGDFLSRPTMVFAGQKVLHWNM